MSNLSINNKTNNPAVLQGAEDINVVIVGLYTYFNVPVRILHPLADRIDGVKAHTIFYKNYDSNLCSLPTEKDFKIFLYF